MLDADLHFTYCNPAWDWFAAENGAPELRGKSTVGTDLRLVLVEALRPFYLRAFDQATQSGKVWECVYECSSPNVFRKFQMRIHPLSPSHWYLITNPIVIERPHTSAVTAALERYLGPDGFITMCSHCRSSRKTGGPEQWDFVPAHLAPHLTNITHGMCPICLEYFYPRPDGFPSS